MSVLDGVTVDIGPQAVVLRSATVLRVASTAPVNGGLSRARTVINLHVSKDHPCTDPAGMIRAYAAETGVPPPWVGLLTAAWTSEAEVGLAASGPIRALAVATVGLSNRIVAGGDARPPEPMASAAGTINVIVAVDADPTAAALLNALLVVAEVKTLTLVEAGIRCAAGPLATGTSTDAVVVAATGRGASAEFGGPATAFGWCVARATREALVPAVLRWQAQHGE